MQEGFPEHHDNPSEWPYWSPSHRAILEQMKQHSSDKNLPKHIGFSDADTRITTVSSPRIAKSSKTP